MSTDHTKHSQPLAGCLVWGWVPVSLVIRSELLLPQHGGGKRGGGIGWGKWRMGWEERWRDRVGEVENGVGREVEG